MSRVFGCDGQLAVKIVMLWISTAPPPQVSSSLLLILSVNTPMNHRSEGWASMQFEQDVWECWKALFSSQIHLRYQEFACNLMMDIMNTNRKWSGKSEWEWWKGEETVTGKTPHKSALLWIYGGQISGFWTLNWELAHLRTSNTCMLQCSSHVSMSCKNKSGANTRDSQLSCFDSVQGL